ncbi:MAG: DegV family protein [Erysipelotrichales bacterium]|nr:DegV family protein [Erysipelotrichales bacterium]
MKFTIIADSACDLKSSDLVGENFEFVTIPIPIVIDGDLITDDESFDTKELITILKASKNFKTSCPPPDAFLQEMRDKDNIFVVTISSGISGTYNSARLAAEMLKEEFPDKKIFVLDSLSATSGQTLILDMLKSLIESELSFEEIEKRITEFRDTVSVRFVVQDLGNLIKTGRMSKLTGKICSILTIRLICGDNGKGEIKVHNKSIGQRRALIDLIKMPFEKLKDKKDSPIIITHCQNEEEALFIKEKLMSKYGFSNIRIYAMRGIASLFANEKGLALSY